MPGNASAHDLAIVGGGIIGLAIAWRASELGLSTVVLERDSLGSGASRVAAGMLAPVTELEFGEDAERLLELGMRSAAMWPAFAKQLQDASGVEVRLQAAGTLAVARDGDEARELERQIALRASLGLPTRRLRPSEAREMEPSLAPTVRLAMEAPDDYSVDPRPAVHALGVACARAGVEIREHTPVDGVEIENDRVAGVRIAGGDLARAGSVVVAAGAWSPQIGGICDRPNVRPVKGQILRLRDPAGPGLLERTVRHEGGYIVPRGDGRYVLGGTVEERGFDANPTAGGVHELLREAFDLVPGISELAIEEISVGFRPGTPDNVPVVGPGSTPGLVWATGHYRNGILLTPVTAELALQALTGTVTA